MGRYLSWLANAGLFVLSCILVANTANTVFASLLTPDPVVVAARAAPSPSPDGRSWQEREVILQRNLFNASLLSPAPLAPVEETEDLEATRLPLSLLGTVAAADPALSWAAVQDLEGRKTLILRNGDPVKRNAKVLRIERRRVVLLENGAARELALDDDDENGGKPPRSTASARPRRGRRAAMRAPANRSTAARVRELAADRYEVPREEIEQAVRNPASIFSQAQIQPKYDEGEMVGMQINAIKPGSLFEEIGIQSGEIITELNGIAIDSPEASGLILTEFAEASEFTVVVEGPDGPRTLTFSPEE